MALKKALDHIDEGRFKDSLTLLKEGGLIYPQMSGAVSQLLRNLEEELEAQSKRAPEEFTVLGGQVKQVLRGLIEVKQWNEAYGVMEQLLPLLPEDLEVLRMKQEILRLGKQG